MICRNGWRRVFWEQEASGWVGSNHIVHIRAERLDGAGQLPEQAKGSSQRGLTCRLTEAGGRLLDDDFSPCCFRGWRVFS